VSDQLPCAGLLKARKASYGDPCKWTLAIRKDPVIGLPINIRLEDSPKIGENRLLQVGEPAMKIILGLITAAAIIFVFYDLQHPEDPNKALVSRQIAFDVMSRFDPGPYRRSLRVDRVVSRNLGFTLQYLDLPRGGLFTVEFETKDVARTVLAQLIKAGRSPTQEGIIIFVSAEQVGLTGETGAALVRPLGQTYYDYNSDTLIFKPPS
jgi:hypothetical protein